jgi:hypothetical protein
VTGITEQLDFESSVRWPSPCCPRSRGLISRGQELGLRYALGRTSGPPGLIAERGVSAPGPSDDYLLAHALITIFGYFRRLSRSNVYVQWAPRPSGRRRAARFYGRGPLLVRLAIGLLVVTTGYAVSLDGASREYLVQNLEDSCPGAGAPQRKLLVGICPSHKGAT